MAARFNRPEIEPARRVARPAPVVVPFISGCACAGGFAMPAAGAGGAYARSASAGPRAGARAGDPALLGFRHVRPALAHRLRASPGGVEARRALCRRLRCRARRRSPGSPCSARVELAHVERKDDRELGARASLMISATFSSRPPDACLDVGREDDARVLGRLEPAAHLRRDGRARRSRDRAAPRRRPRAAAGRAGGRGGERTKRALTPAQSSNTSRLRILALTGSRAEPLLKLHQLGRRTRPRRAACPAAASRTRAAPRTRPRRA